jgi:cardiolipin synthase
LPKSCGGELQFFIIKDDRLGRELKDRLIRKARENIRVYFLFDEIGSYALPKAYIQEMRREGIITSPFHTTRGKTNRFQLNFRNHRKIVVVDGLCAFVGGHNVGDEYVSEHPKLGSWRDTHVKVQAPVVQAVQFCFLEDWYWATTGVPTLNWHLQRAQHGHEKALLIPSGPGR